MSKAEKIKKNFGYLKEEIDEKHIKDVFIQQGVLSFDDAEEIDAAGITSKKTALFLEKIYRKGDQGYEVLIEALRDVVERDDVVDQLEATEVEEPVNRYEALSKDEKQMKITEKSVLRFRNIAPCEMTDLAIIMGFTDTDVQVIKMENQFSVPTQLTKLWIKWKRTEGKKATLGKLTEILIELESAGTTVNWSVYEEGKQFVIEENNAEKKK